MHRSAGLVHRLGGRPTTGTRPAVIALVLVLLVLPLLVEPARGASTTTRLDWGSKASMPTARAALGFAAAPNGKLYAVGGRGSSTPGCPPLPNPPVERRCAALEEYDPATNTWTTKAPIPTPRDGIGWAAAPNGKLYAVGGTADSGVCQDAPGAPSTEGPYCTVVEEYDPGANTWVTRAPLPSGRGALALALATNGRLYAIGGRGVAPGCPKFSNGLDGYCIIVEEYDPIANSWATRAPMPTARGGLGLAAAVNGKLYAVGGLDDDCPSLVCGAVEEYDPATNVWTNCGTPAPGNACAPMLTARVSLGFAAAPNGNLYAVGGFPGANIPACPSGNCTVVEAYDPSANAWTPGAAMPTARHALGLASAPNGRVYAVGGIAASTTPACPSRCVALEELDPATNTWASVPVRSALPTPRFYAASAVANGKVYVFGGNDGAGHPLHSTYQYDPSTGTWTPMADMLTGRYAATAVTVTVNGSIKIYVVGGSGASPPCSGFVCTTVEELTPPPVGGPTGSWRGVANSIQQLPVARFLHGMALAQNGKLYVVGGSDGTQARGEAFEYDPVTNAPWRTVANMPTARSGLSLAPAGDGKLYAVGGSAGTTVLATVERFVPPTSSSLPGTWEAAGGIAQLPAPRVTLGLIGAPNGKLYAVGGSDVGAGPGAPKAEVYEFDGATNAWTTRAPMPTARYGLSVTLDASSRLLAIAGYDGAALGTVQEATLTEVPSASAGGPYTVASGSSVGLNGSGSDPEGTALNFAWDLNGDLLYETAGQNPTFSAAGLPAGTRTVRVRTMDANGAYAVASATVTVTAGASACSPRPNVGVASTRLGAGQIQTTLTAQTNASTPTNSLISIRFTRITNAAVRLNGSPVTVGPTFDLPRGAQQATLLIDRHAPDQNPSLPSMVAFAVTDACGEWNSFVGGGSGAF